MTDYRFQYLKLNAKRYNHSSGFTTEDAFLGTIRGKGSSTRMYNFCVRETHNPIECIDRIIYGENKPIPDPESLKKFIQTTNFPNVVSEERIQAFNGFLYVLGGDYSATSGGGGVANTRYASILVDGSVGTWNNSTNLIVGRERAASVITWNKFVYIIGGNAGGNAQSTVQFATINPNGTLSAWAGTSNMPVGRRRCPAVQKDGWIYVMGSSNANFNTVNYAQTSSVNGTIVGAWATTTPMPDGRFWGSAVIYDNTVYYFMGSNSSGVPQSTIWSININPITKAFDMSWNILNSFPTTLQGHSAVLIGNRVYIIGGLTGTAFTSVTDSIYYADINVTTKVIGPWTLATYKLLAPLAFGDASAYNGKIYYVGGQTFGGVAVNIVQYLT